MLIIYLTILLFILSPIQGLSILPATILGIVGLIALLKFQLIQYKFLYLILISNYIYWGLNLFLHHNLNEVFVMDFVRWQMRGFFCFLPLFAWLSFNDYINESKIKLMVYTLIFPAIFISIIGILIITLNINIPELKTDIEFSLYPIRKVIGENWFFGMHRSHLAAGGFYLTIVIILISLLSFWDTKKEIYIGIFIGIVINLWALVYSKSRIYMFSFLITPFIFILIAFIFKQRRIILRTITLVLCSILILTLFIFLEKSNIRRILYFKINPTLENSQEKLIPKYNVYDRTIYWKASFEMIKKHPIIGVGFGNFKKEFKRLGYKLNIMPIKENMMHAHNSYLHITAEFGIIGLILFLIMWIFIIWGLIVKLRNSTVGSYEIAFIIGILGIVGTQSFAALFDYNFWSPSIMLPITALIGMALKLNQK